MTSSSRPPRRLPRAVALAASTSLLMLAADAAAQPADSEERARTLYEEGTRLLDAGATAEACPKLEEAVRLVPDASGAHLALGVCLERAGRLATALHHLERAEALADPVALGERRERAAQAAAALRPRVARIRVVVEQGTSSSAVVTIDGRVVPRGEAVAVDAGRHEVVLSDMGGRALARHSLQVVDGALERVVLSGPAAPVSTTSLPRPQGGDDVVETGAAGPERTTRSRAPSTTWSE